MAYVLSLQPHSPLKRSFSDNPYLRSCSSNRELLSPLGDITGRNASTCSLYTLESNRAGDWYRGTENISPFASQTRLELVPESNKFEFSQPCIDHELRGRSYGLGRAPLSLVKVATLSNPIPSAVVSEQTSQCSVSSDDMAEVMDVDDSGFEESELFDLYEAIRSPLPKETPSESTCSEVIELEAHIIGPVSTPPKPQPFRRWISILRRRHIQRHQEHVPESTRMSLDTTKINSSLQFLIPQLQQSTRRTSGSMSSSMGCVTIMKSASITIAGTSIAPRSDMGAYRTRLGNRSSNYSEARRSMESHRGALGPVIDEGAWLRSLQRRKVVEELVASEEGYIADLKVLINDYFMILIALPTLSSQAKSSIQQNISQILQLHEDLLAELHQAVPQADFTKSAQQESYPVTKAKHIRFHSADIVPGRFAEHKVTRKLRHSLEIGRSPDKRPRGLVTDTSTVGEIAKIFNRHMKRFFTYEEYGAHWTTMSSDLTMTCKGLHGWQEYERGVEALQKVIASENNRESGSKKALSFPDLLIKPIQRVCKYPLLFGDLCRHTPVYDDPEAHAELEKALFRLQETIREVNKAKDDPKTRRLIEITWQLQDRLEFQEQAISRALVFRLIGHVLLSGVLHVSYQTSDRIKGQYMVCVLYKSCLVLATTNRSYTPYTVVASIALANGSIEQSDNGRGLQCHAAPHTWKFVFEHNHRLHEIILSACSSQEEAMWKTQLRERIACETHDFVEGQSTMQDMFSTLTLDVKSLGPVFGHTDSMVRRMSIHRAATLGAKTNLSQVIIKNTQAEKLQQSPPAFSPGVVSRSQSLLSSNHVPTLAPRRAERIRLETAMEDVWTKDVLPFPGMSNRRVENQIRASANSVMRKLSMASIASNFSRRSPSFSSMSNTRSEDSYGSRMHRVSQGNLRVLPARSRRPAPAVVDFHNAPAAFLPVDFELEDVRSVVRSRRVANRAGGVQWSSESSTPGKPKRTRRLSTHIIRLPRSESNARLAARTSSNGSNSTVLHVAEPARDAGKSHENGKVKKRDGRDHTTKGEHSASTPMKKFAKSKSKIFKFWT